METNDKWVIDLRPDGVRWSEQVVREDRMEINGRDTLIDRHVRGFSLLYEATTAEADRFLEKDAFGGMGLPDRSMHYPIRLNKNGRTDLAGYVMVKEVVCYPQIGTAEIEFASRGPFRFDGIDYGGQQIGALPIPVIDAPSIATD